MCVFARLTPGLVERLGVTVLALGLVAAPAARAQTIAPFSAPVGNLEGGNLEFSLGGRGDLAGMVAGPNDTGQGNSGLAGSAALRLSPSLERDYDSGLVIALRSTLLAYHDRLSVGRYTGDLIEKFTGEVQSGLGRLAVGQTDGAAYALAVGAPKIDPAISLDDPEITLFRDPASGQSFRPLGLTTAVQSSSDYAKIVYTSPTLFGTTLALSFTPSEGKYILPFLREGPQAANRQADIWEAGVRYSDDFGPITLAASGGIAEGRGERKTAGHEGLSDIALGMRADYHADDELTFSLGGGWRRTNAYDFGIMNVFASGTTQGAAWGASVNEGGWVAGIEYADGIAEAETNAPRLGLNGYQASVGYDISENFRLTGGWQKEIYARGSGLFYNGGSHIQVDAGFLHLDIHV